jgi:hypothetical protein
MDEETFRATCQEAVDFWPGPALTGAPTGLPGRSIA